MARSRTEIAAERAGMELGAARGATLLTPDEIYRPHSVWLADTLEGETVVGWRSWDPDAPMETPREKAKSTGVLRAFCALAEADAKAFLRFAKRYGPLELCEEHELPVGHSPYAASLHTPGAAEPCFAPRAQASPDEPHWRFVPVEVWRRYARDVQGALSLAAAHHNGRIGPRDDWNQLLRWLEIDVTPKWLGDLADERFFLAFIVDRWVDLSGLRPTLSWTDKRPEIGLGSGELFGAVLRELIFAIGRVHGLKVCAGCGEPFIAQYRRKWCARCGKKAADRAAQRRRRAKIRKVNKETPDGA
ncbi:MAG TPA: hypothetical protein VML95_03450 [Longimicrobiales bacterium]|nr:hypothetical protein [Longimicrobiales bacterium]